MKPNLFIAIALSLLATFFYASQTAIVKAYAATVPLPMIIFIQCLTGLLLFILIFFIRGYKAKEIIFTQNRKIHLLRTLCSLSVAFCLFTAVKYIPLVNAMLLANVAPMIVPFLAYFFLSQSINHQIWLPILIGFIGVGFVLHPDGHFFHLASLLAFGSSVFAAGTIVMVRNLSRTDSSETITFYFYFFGTLLTSVFALKYWVPISAWMAVILIGVGVLYFASQYLITYALRLASAEFVSSLMYMNIVYSAVISILMWHVTPSVLTWLGIALTIMGGILCIRVEHRQNRYIYIETEPRPLGSET